MKTVQQLKDKNQEIVDAFPPPHNSEDKAFKNACKEVGYNNLAIQTLETLGVTQLRLETDLQNLKDKMVRIKENYTKWKENTSFIEQGNDPLATYNRLHETKDVKEKIKFIQFLLE